MVSDPKNDNSPAFRSPEYLAMEPGWRFMRLVRKINDSIRTRAAEILPRYDAEGDKEWRTRCNMTFGFDALDETIGSFTGLAMANDPVLEKNVPERIRKDCEDVDCQGTHLAVFTATGIDTSLQDGHCAILVDMKNVSAVVANDPAASERGALRKDQEQALGQRAYMVLVTIDRITAWRIDRILGRRCIAMVKILEPSTAPSGRFGTVTVERYRTLTQEVNARGTPYVHFVVEELQDDKTFRLVEEGDLVGPKWIPLHPANGGDPIDLLESRPPLLGMAYSNLDHTQIKSDRRYSLHKCAIAVPVFRGRLPVKNADGEETGDVVLSHDTGIDVSEQGGAEYLEPAGNALNALRDELADIERRMATQGLSMLRREPQSGNQTLGEKMLQAAREESKLSRCVRSWNDALEAALGSMAAFYGMTLVQGGNVTMNRQFTDVYLTDSELHELESLEETGRLTYPTFMKILSKRTRLLDGVDVEQEIKDVEQMRADEQLIIDQNTDPTIDPLTGEKIEVTPPDGPQKGTPQKTAAAAGA
jgi:hypothetical protein